MSKKEKPVYEHPWLDPKYDRPRRWPIITAAMVISVLVCAGVWLGWRYDLLNRLIPQPVSTEVTVTATATVSATPTSPSPTPSSTASTPAPDPDPVPAPAPEPVPTIPVVEPAPTYAPQPAPPIVIGAPPVIHGFSCSRDGQSFAAQVVFNAWGVGGSATITIGPVNLPTRFSPGTTSASASAMISAHSQTCTATITTSSGTVSSTTQTN